MTTTSTSKTTAPARTTRATGTKSTGTKKPAVKPAPKAKTPQSPRTLARTDGTQKCEGPCGKVLPMTKFPTKASKPGEVPARGTVCRRCMAAVRDANKKAAAAKK